MSLPRTQLGRTILRVSTVGFGGIPITRLSDSAAEAVVRAAVDAGINFIDTAYGYPHSEERIGRAIRPLDRASLVIATKDPSSDGPMFRAHVEESLRRLQTDYLDLIQFHNISDADRLAAVLAPGAAYDVALDLRDRGLVRHIGVSSHSIDFATKMIDSGRFDTVQLPLNFIADEAEPLVQLCIDRGVGFIGMKPFAGGVLEDGPLALRYLRQFPSVVPIPGIETLDELRQIVDAFSAPGPLTDDDRRRIADLRKEIGKVFCRACGYCQPCPQDIGIAMVLRARSFAKRMPVDMAVRALGTHMTRAERCTDCGQCIDRCPYHLPIPELIRSSRQWFTSWRETVD